MTKKLTDIEVYDRVYAASLAMGEEEGETVLGNTTLEAARRALVLLQLGLLYAMEKGESKNKSIKAQKPDGQT